MTGRLVPVLQELFSPNPLQPAGKLNVMVPCPLHRNQYGQQESRASFGIHTENGLWNCYSCGEKGNLRQLLQKMGLVGEGPLPVQWTEVLEAIKADAPIERRKEGFYLHPFPDDLVLEEHVLGLFQRIPLQMVEWGFHRRILQRYDVGFDVKHLRITFPLRDYIGQLVGFSGRTVADEIPRYKVYTEREYERWGLPPLPPAPKGQLLWGYHQAVATLQQNPDQPVVLVEGFKAHLWLVQAGFSATIALLGSSMTDEQQHLLERLGGTLYLFLDNDAAGEKKYALAQRLSPSCDVRIPEYPTKQPDELHPQTIPTYLANSPSYVTWKLQRPPTINPYTYIPKKRP